MFALIHDVHLDKHGFTVGVNDGVVASEPNPEVFKDMLSKIEDAGFNTNAAGVSYSHLYYESATSCLKQWFGDQRKSRSCWIAMRDRCKPPTIPPPGWMTTKRVVRTRRTKGGPCSALRDRGTLLSHGSKFGQGFSRRLSAGSWSGVSRG